MKSSINIETISEQSKENYKHKHKKKTKKGRVAGENAQQAGAPTVQTAGPGLILGTVWFPKHC